MATCLKIDDTKNTEEDDLTKCSICLEVFNTPKYLPCLHTFCLTCLQEYITSSSKEEKLGFNCPICRAFVPTKSNIPTDMASEIPTNHLIVSLMDRTKINKNCKTCDPCGRRTKQTQATMWCCECCEALCEECGEFHKSMKALLSHRLTPIQELIEKQFIVSTSQDFCESHRDKKLEIFCFDHNTPCCLTCMTVHHRKCEKVTTIDEAAKGIKESTETLKLLTQFNTIASDCEKIVNDCQKNFKTLDEEKNEIKSKVKAIRKNIFKHFEALEAKQLEDINAAHKEQSLKVQAQADEFENTLKIATNCKNVLVNCIKSASDVQVLLQVMKLEERKTQCEESIRKEGNDLRQIHLELRLNENTEKISTFYNTFGEVFVSKSTEDTIPRSLSFVDLRKVSFQKISSFSVFETIDRKKVCISGGTCLSDDRILLVDYYLQRLLIYKDNGTKISMITLPDTPWDVAKIGTEEVAVTLPNLCLLQMVNIESLSLNNQINVKRQCWGIAFAKHFILARISEIIIVDIHGNLIQCIPTTSNAVYYVEVYEGDKIWYTDRDKSSIHCINIKGEELTKYMDSKLKSPAGIVSDIKGNVYVAGRGTDNVHQFGSDGTHVRVLLSDDSISRPQVVLFSKEKNRCYVIFDQILEYGGYGGTAIAIFNLTEKAQVLVKTSS